MENILNNGPMKIGTYHYLLEGPYSPVKVFILGIKEINIKEFENYTLKQYTYVAYGEKTDSIYNLTQGVLVFKDSDGNTTTQTTNVQSYIDYYMDSLKDDIKHHV